MYNIVVNVVLAISNNQHNYKKIKMSSSKKWAH